jgi:hypothetical protein
VLVQLHQLRHQLAVLHQLHLLGQRALQLLILIILRLPAKLHGTSAEGTAHLQCAPSSALSTTGSFASGLVIVE